MWKEILPCVLVYLYKEVCCVKKAPISLVYSVQERKKSAHSLIYEFDLRFQSKGLFAARKE